MSSFFGRASLAKTGNDLLCNISPKSSPQEEAPMGQNFGFSE